MTKTQNKPKKYTFTRQFVGSAALFAGLIPAVSTAQTSDLATLDEIVSEGKVLFTDQIHALKTPTPIIDVPQSLSIITADQMTLQGFTSVGDIIDYTPGVNTSQGEGHRDAVVFRGVRSTADFFLDGVRDDVQYYRSLYNVEQVEILRGPNALFFGRGGTGGILNRVTKKGVIGESFNAYKASIDTFGEFSVQLDSNFATSENSAFRINAYYESLENHRDFYDGDRIGVNPTAKIALSDKTTVDLSYEYVDNERFVDRGIPTGANGEPVEAFEDIIFGDVDNQITEFEAHILKASVQHMFADNLKGRLNVSYGDYDKLYGNFYASGYDQVNTPNIVELDGYIDTTQRESLTFSGDIVGELETGSINHTLVGGFEYIDTGNDNDRFNPVFSSNQDDREEFIIQNPLDFRGFAGTNADGEAITVAYSDLNDDTSADLAVYSFFINDEIEVTEQLDLILGARYDSFEIDVTNQITGEDFSREDSEVTPRLGIVYKPQENISVYASYSETFLPSSGEQFASINDTSSRLDPSEFTNTEAGVKWDFTQGLSLTLSIFEIEASQPQVDPNDSEGQVFVDSDITGFEAQIQGSITDKWSVIAGYSYLDAEIVNLDGPTGRRPREIPEHTFSIWNTYQVTDKFGLGLGLTYQDETFISNSLSSIATLPSYTRVDAAAYYTVSENLRIQVNVENLTDELYFPNSHSTHQATVGAPINATFTIVGRF
ncbi:MAG: TonB-dependent siderophore receptor [Verrucomicrobiota bacterium]